MMVPNESIRLLMNRKSTRAFTEQEISEESKQIILHAAAAAPTAGNQQLYTILDITDEGLKKALAESCDHQPFIAEAKILLIFCADCKKWYAGFEDCGCNPRHPGPGDLLLAFSDANIAAQNAVMAAESLGIGSCYIGDIMENIDTHRRLLKLPEFVVPAAMLVFGYPTEQQKERVKPARAPLDKIVSENAYPQMDAAYREELFAWKSAAKSYPDWMEAFCKRKYNSAFSREMSRSVAKYLQLFLSEDPAEA